MPQVRITHPDRVLFPDCGVTKGDVAEYYGRVAPLMTPHLRGRPVSMQRFPEGIAKKGFFHKNVPDYFPGWIEKVTVGKSGGTVTHAVVNDADSLAYLANHGTITPHVWLSRAGSLRKPDRLVFDLDPSVDHFGAVRKAARDVAAILADLGLPAYPMVTGSSGIHLWVPIRRDRATEEVKRFTRGVAALAASRHPEELTTEWRKEKRENRILVDVARHGYAQTVVPPFAIRARPGAPVAMPITLADLSDSKLAPDRWNTRNAFRRLGRTGDAWGPLRPTSIAQAERKLAKLRPAD